MRDSTPREIVEQRARVYPAAILIAFAAAFALRVLSADGITAGDGRLGGDFPAFYAAGSLVGDGRASELYDWQALARAQVGLHPQAPERFFPFAYPPFVAAAYAPLAKLDYVTAYVIHTLVMAGFLFWAAVWIAPELRRIGSHRLALYAGLLAFYPMLRAVSGQNTALSALLVAGVWRGLADRRDAWAGIALGLLLYKPQLALPLGGLVALAGHSRTLLWALAPAGALYALGAATSGWAWPAVWWHAVLQFQAYDQAGNASHSIGILGVLEALLGVGNPVAQVAGGLAILALTLFLARTWHRGDRPLGVRMGLACCGMALIPPHSMYYEAGLSGFGLAVLADAGWSLWLVAALHLLAFTEPLSSRLGVNPLFALVAAIAFFLARAAAPSMESPSALSAPSPR